VGTGAVPWLLGVPRVLRVRGVQRLQLQQLLRMFVGLFLFLFMLVRQELVPRLLGMQHRGRGRLRLPRLQRLCGVQRLCGA